MKNLLLSLFLVVSTPLQANCNLHYYLSTFVPSDTPLVGLKQAKRSALDGTVLSEGSPDGKMRIVVFDNNTAVEGQLASFIEDSAGQPAYLGFNSSSRLLGMDKNGFRQLPGQGFAQHPLGFGMPVGTPSNITKDVKALKKSDWAQAGVKEGEEATIEYPSGVVATGEIEALEVDSSGIVKVIKFKTGTAEVKLGEQTLFAKDWGQYDLLVGSKIVNSEVSTFSPNQLLDK